MRNASVALAVGIMFILPPLDHVDASTSTEALAGAKATYIALVSQPNSQVVIERDLGAETPTLTRTTTVTHRAIRFDAEVVSVNGNVLVVQVDSVENGRGGRARYRTTLAALQPRAAVSLGRFSETLRATAGATDALVSIAGTTVTGWIDHLTMEVSGASWRYALDVALVDVRGPRLAEAAVLLLPNLAAPSEALALIAGATPPTAASARLAAPFPVTTRSAYSRLTTIDNPAANLRVWYSDLTFTGYLDDAETEYLAYLAVLDWQATFFNWVALEGAVMFTNVSPSQATVSAMADFLGIFPLGPVVLWHGAAAHRITLYLSSHQVWLSGEINAFSVVPTGIWIPWKRAEFYSGGSYLNDGSRQDASWFIVN